MSGNMRGHYARGGVSVAIMRYIVYAGMNFNGAEMYYEMIQNKPHFTRAKRGSKVPDGKTHYSIAYRYPDTCEILWHSQSWQRLGHIIKPIEDK